MIKMTPNQDGDYEITHHVWGKLATCHSPDHAYLIRTALEFWLATPAAQARLNQGLSGLAAYEQR